MSFPFYSKPIPYLTTEQMIEVDRAMIEDYKIDLIQMMENAGRNLADLARLCFFGGDPRGKKAVVLAGTGGNGGGALVCARHLHIKGADVKVFITKAGSHFSPVPAHQLDIVQQMEIPVTIEGDLSKSIQADLIIDGIIGYSLKGAPRGNAATLIQWANGMDSPILSLDVPSGIDTTTGTAFEPAIRAAATMTLALPKEGLRAPGVEAHVGDLYLANISVPPQLYARPPLNLNVGSIFAQSDIVRLG